MIARFAMRGPHFAAGTAAAFLLAALLFPFLVIPAGAVVALVTLRHGARQGLVVGISALGLVLVVRLALGHGGLPLTAIYAGLVFLPAWAAGNVLRTRADQALALLVAGAAALIYVAGLRAAVGDVDEFWRGVLESLFSFLQRETGSSVPEDQRALLIAQMHVRFVIVLSLLLTSMVLVARWWQGLLYNPGGFGTEFRAFAMPRRALTAALVLTLLDLAANQGIEQLALAGDACVILVVLFAFQGLAVIHHRAHATAMPRGWLVGLYVALGLLPQLCGPLLATAGLLDCAVDLRRRRAPP